MKIHVINRNYCYPEMPNENNKISEYNQEENSLKVPFIIHADLEVLLAQMSSCQNNQEKS